ncbi:MAG TPA: hypothetical protein VJ486_07445 [Geothrix sp.]|nr:hypothetical protein [Geothrix sp.]
MSGFSLVELLVALVFTALLMAGMAGVFQSSVRTFAAVNETMGAQRTNRWALDQVSDDISQAGLIFPDRPLPAMVMTGAESLFSITPDAPVVGVTRVSDTNPSSTESETILADVFQYFTDVPLPISGTWAVDTAGDAALPPDRATINFNPGSNFTDLQADDVMIILDSGENGKWESPLITGPSNPVVWDTNPVSIANFTLASIAGGIAHAHNQGVPVYFIRPAQLVRYSVQAVSLDPANVGVKLPCLVRQQANYPTGGNVAWANVSSQIVAENVQGFRVDVSFDGGKTWARTTGSPSTWGAIQANANAQLAAVGLPGLNSITDSANPDWFRSIGCIMRVDITTRAPIRRDDYSATPGARAYRTRTQTLMISPRNFRVGK